LRLRFFPNDDGFVNNDRFSLHDNFRMMMMDMAMIDMIAVISMMITKEQKTSSGGRLANEDRKPYD
jgi:hypothetical protein